MFELNEAVRGRLISPKTWDQIYIIFETKMEQPVTAPRLFWVDLIVLWDKSCNGLDEVGNGRENRVHQVNR